MLLKQLWRNICRSSNLVFSSACSVTTRPAGVTTSRTTSRPSTCLNQPRVYIVIKCARLKMLLLLMFQDIIGLRKTLSSENTQFQAYRFVYLTLLRSIGSYKAKNALVNSIYFIYYPKRSKIGVHN